MQKEFPVIGFGTWLIVGNDVKTSIKSAIANGYKHIDTAQIYNNEKQIGETLQELQVKEDDLFIITKVYFLNYRRAYESVKESAKRLQVKKIDLVLLHSPLKDEFFNDVVKAYKDLMKAREEGLIAKIGVSNFSTRQLEKLLLETKDVPFCNQIVVSPTTRIKSVEKFCKEKNIKLIGYSIIKPYFNPNPFYEGSGMNNEQKLYIDNLAKKYHKDAGQILNKWAIQLGYYIIPKSVKPARIKSNKELSDFNLTDLEMNELSSWNKLDESKLEQIFDNIFERYNIGNMLDKLITQGMKFQDNFDEAALQQGIVKEKKIILD